MFRGLGLAVLCFRRARRERVALERQRVIEVAAKLDRLRRRHEADKESARRTYMESKRYLVVVVVLPLFQFICDLHVSTADRDILALLPAMDRPVGPVVFVQDESSGKPYRSGKEVRPVLEIEQDGTGPGPVYHNCTGRGGT